MIRTMLRAHWLNLKRDRAALLLMFVLPLAFFAIFAFIFGGMAGGGGNGGPSSLDIVIADLDDTPVSRDFATTLSGQEGLRARPLTEEEATETAPEAAPSRDASALRESARQAVRGGGVDAAVIIPQRFAETFSNFGGDRPAIEIIYDPANPLAQHMLNGMLQAAAMTAAPDILMEGGFEQLERFGGELTQQQRDAINVMRPFLRGERDWSELDETDPATTAAQAETAPPGSDDAGFTGLVPVQATSARAANDDDRDSPNRNSIIAYYAAGIGVMFLLFSMAGASSSLLEQEEAGTLDRLLMTRLSMGGLLISSWLFFALAGFVQVAVMFAFGWLAFGLDLLTPNHLAGFIVMTVVTAPAAAAFALILATICRTRAQLSAVSTIVILIMSALGGSMVPRFVMPEFMNTTALFTFNGWAMDGYLKVFWYDDPSDSPLDSVIALWPQLAALAAMTIVFLLLARLFARRWETA